MDINDIKPPGSDGRIVGAGTDAPVESKGESSFAEAQGKLQATDSPPVSPPALGVVKQFDRTVLNDPAKLEDAVRASVSELIDAGQSVTGPLSSAEKQSLVEFLSADPLMRKQIETYLQKVLV